MMNKFPGGGYPKMAFGSVDVRDVAQAHLLCLTNDSAQGMRFILANGTYWLSETAEVLRSLFGKYGYPIPSTETKLEDLKAFA